MRVNMDLVQTPDRWVVPFKIPTDYFTGPLKSDPSNLDRSPEILKGDEEWLFAERDLHVYPYTEAVSGLLSVGCPLRCFYCPTALLHKGKSHYADPEVVIPQYSGQSVHWMDENFFTHPDIDRVLELLKSHNVTWLAMSDSSRTVEALSRWGEDYLYSCGCRVIEMGLENVVHFRKVKPSHSKVLDSLSSIQIYYLNMTFFPKETKESIRENGEWMRHRGLKDPIYHDNAVYYSGGQYFFPYKPEHRKGLQGIMIEGPKARTRPTFVPKTFLEQTYETSVANVAEINSLTTLSFGFSLPKDSVPLSGLIYDFIGLDQQSQSKARWLVTGFRTGLLK